MNIRTTHIAILLSLFVFVGASCRSQADGGMFRSTESGTQWEQKVFVGQENKKVISIASADIQTIEFDKQNEGTIYIGTKTAGIYKTVNAGEQWRRLPVNPDRIRDVAVDPSNSDIIYSIKNSNIIKSSDSGETWEIVYTDSQNAVITRIDVDWYNPKKIIAVTSIGTVLISTDEGATWQVVYKVDEPLVGIEINQTDSRIMYVVELEKSIHRTVDGGETWTSLMSDNDAFEDFMSVEDSRSADEVRSLVQDPNNSQVLYAVTNEGVLRTEDGGGSWSFVETLIERGAEQNAAILNFTVMPGDSNTLFFSIGRLIHKSVDRGETWQTEENFPSKRKITAFAIDPFDTTVYYAGVEQVEEQRKFFFGP